MTPKTQGSKGTPHVKHPKFTGVILTDRRTGTKVPVIARKGESREQAVARVSKKH